MNTTIFNSFIFILKESMMEKKELQEKIDNIIKTEVFEGKTLENIISDLYTNIISDRNLAITTVKEIKDQVALDPGTLNYLKLEELKHLKESNDQVLKLVTQLKDILLKSDEENSGVAGFLIHEEERRWLLENPDSKDSKAYEIEEAGDDNYDGAETNV